MSIYDHSPAPLFPPSSSSTEQDHLRPSIFELLANEQLHELFGPVVRYTLAYLAQRYPRRLTGLVKYHPEWTAVLLGLVENYHLKRHNASVSEHFYGLHIVSTGVSANRPLRRLRRNQRWALLFFLVGVPYLRQRAQTYYDQLSDSAVSESSARHTLSRRFRRLFILLYPYIDLSYALWLLSYDLRFLFDRTPFYRPWHRLLRIQLRRIDPDSDTDLDSPSPAGLTSYLPPLLPPLLLALKFSQWWYSPGSPRSLQETTKRTHHARIPPPRPLPILPSSGLLTPPPSPPLSPSTVSPSSSPSTRPHIAELTSASTPAAPAEMADSAYRISSDEYGLCPLCGRKWQNPAVLPSGWVVCWRCGWDAVEGEELEGAGRRGRCPITGVEVRPGQLRRVLV